jgi:hypothetical protein
MLAPHLTGLNLCIRDRRENTEYHAEIIYGTVHTRAHQVTDIVTESLQKMVEWA